MYNAITADMLGLDSAYMVILPVLTTRITNHNDSNSAAGAQLCDIFIGLRSSTGTELQRFNLHV